VNNSTRSANSRGLCVSSRDGLPTPPKQVGYRTLNRAFRLLYHNPGAKLIALGMTRYWLAWDGIALDVAPSVAALEHATARQPIVFGKPAEHFFPAAAERLGLAPEEVLMIGDDIEADVC
jgi:ribonucleotide monophosphatase NagD (HAD superfamily)